MKRLLIAIGIAGGMLASGAVGAVASNGWSVPEREVMWISTYPAGQKWVSLSLCGPAVGDSCVMLHSDYTWEWSTAVPYSTQTAY